MFPTSATILTTPFASLGSGFRKSRGKKIVGRLLAWLEIGRKRWCLLKTSLSLSHFLWFCFFLFLRCLLRNPCLILVRLLVYLGKICFTLWFNFWQMHALFFFSRIGPGWRKGGEKTKNIGKADRGPALPGAPSLKGGPRSRCASPPPCPALTATAPSNGDQSISK